MKNTMKVGALALATLTALPVMAGSINLDIRYDYLSQGWNDDAKLAAGGLASNTKHYLQTARLDFKGNLNDATSYRVRTRIAGKDQGAMSKRDSTDLTLDLAFVTNKFDDMFSLTVGKLATDLGGYEGQTTGADVYMQSESWNGTKTFSPTSYLSGQTTYSYATGVKGTVAFAGHTLDIMSTNMDGSVGRNQAGNGDNTNSNGNLAQTGSMNGVVFKGSFLDKSLGVVASLHTQKASNATYMDAQTDYTTVGAQYSMMGITAQLDYSMSSFKYKATGAGTPDANDKLASTILNVRYALNDTMTPFAKYVSSEETLDATATGGTSTKNKYSSYSIGGEWKPVKADNFRYHVAYNSRTMKPDSGNDRVLTEVLAGVRISADFLK